MNWFSVSKPPAVSAMLEGQKKQRCASIELTTYL
jgi:hypothetical protein